MARRDIVEKLSWASWALVAVVAAPLLTVAATPYDIV